MNKDEQRLNGVEREVVQRRTLKAGVVGLRGTTVVASTRDSGNWEFHRIPWECGELSCGPEVTRELSGGHQGGGVGMQVRAIRIWTGLCRKGTGPHQRSR